MALSFVQYTGDGTNKVFNVTFQYLQQANVLVKVDDVTVTFTFLDSGRVELTNAPTSGAAVEIRRLSDRTARVVDYQDGAVIHQATLDADSNQIFHVAQEAFDASDNTLQLSFDGKYDATSKRIKNVADPVNAQDVATKYWAESVMTSELVGENGIAASFHSNSYTGDGSTVAFAMDYVPNNKANTQVFIDGVYQTKLGYSYVSTTLTFSEAPPLNSSVEIVVARALNLITGDSGVVTYVQGGTGSVTRTVGDKLQETVSVKDFGAVGDGVTDDTAAIQAAQDSLETVGGGILFWPIGTYKITASITVNVSVMWQGSGSEDCIISNETNDVRAVYVDGTTTRVDRFRMKNIRINHKASSYYAIQFDMAPYSELEDVTIVCGGVGTGLGKGGVLFGDELTTPASQAYLGVMRNCRILHYTTYGVRVNSTGHTWNFQDCFVGSSGTGNNAGATGGYFNNELVHVLGGQWSANNVGGHQLHFYNTNSGTLVGGSVKNVKFESVDTGEYGVVVDGVGRFNGVDIENLGGNLNVSVLGTLIKFGNARYCKVTNPIIQNPTSGGKLIEFGASSFGCIIECDAESASAPMTVHASATTALKRVVGFITSIENNAITTYANLTVVLQEGMNLLPTGFTPAHNGVAWNYFIVGGLGDDAATSLTPPTSMGIGKLINDDDAKTFGIFSYDTVTPTCEALAAGSKFAATTGVLTGATGTENYITTSAHTDGKVYIEARRGSSSITVLFDTAVYGV